MLEPEKYKVIEIDEHPDIFVEDTDNNNIVTKSTFLEGCRNFTALRIQKRLIYKVSTLYAVKFLHSTNMSTLSFRSKSLEICASF